jgi:hypothetical protein
MLNYESVGDFSNPGENARMLIPAKETLPGRVVRQRPKRGLCAKKHRAVRLDEVNRRREDFTWQFGELFRHAGLLKGKVLDAVAGGSLPAMNPAGAEVAIAVEDHRRLWRRRGHVLVKFHGVRVEARFPACR